MPEMPKFEKPPADLVARFEAVLARVATPETSRRLVADDAQVEAWVSEALACTASMPPKEPKARTKR